VGESKYTINTHLTEPISDGQAFGSGYLSILSDGSFQGRNEVKTKQYITLSDVADVQFTTSDKNNEKAEDYLVFDSDVPAYTYRMDFTPRAESELDGSDFEGQKLTILGREYRITSADVSSNTVTLRMLSGDVRDVLSEATTNTYTIDGSTFTVSVTAITTDKVKMTINEKDMSSMESNKAYAIPGTAMYIGIGEILENEAGEAGAGADMVEFYLGASLLELKDDDITDSEFNSDGLSYNSKRISDVYVRIIGDTDEHNVKLGSISIEWQPDDEIQIPIGEGLYDYTSEGQIFTSTDTHKAFDVVLSSEVSGNKETIELRPVDDSTYKLSFETLKSSYSLDVYGLDGVSIVTDIYVTEGDTATPGDIVVFSKDKDTVIAKISYISVDADGNGHIKLNDMGGESNRYNIVSHVASVVWHGNDYTLTEQNDGSQVELTDLNGNGVTGEKVGIWTRYGGEIRIGYDKDWASVKGVTFLEHEDGKEDTSHRGSTEILFTKVSRTLYAGVPTFTDYSTINFVSYKDENYARTLWGTHVVDDAGTQKKIILTYPENELNFNVNLVGGSAAEIVTSTPVSNAEWAILSDKIAENRNIIVVGGPCVNEVAASLLESGEDCTRGFTTGESMIKLIDLKTGYYAIIIAGYTKEDTADAVHVFNSYKSYPKFIGEEVKLNGRIVL
jgi:hypothetical protein